MSQPQERESAQHNHTRRGKKNGQLHYNAGALVTMTASGCFGRRGEAISPDGIARTVTAHYAKNRDEGMVGL